MRKQSYISRLRTCLLATLLILVAPIACDHSPAEEGSVAGILYLPIEAEGHKELQNILRQQNYSWKTLQAGVPPLMLKHLPDDLHQVKSVTQKKRLFFLALLPMALLANEEIADQRRTVERLISKHDSGQKLTTSEISQLKRIKTRYNVKGDVLADPHQREKLLLRVDTIPPAMLLAQAANESGWGSSRFAKLANNLFGEWTFTPGQGIVPENRPAGETYEVKRFSSLYQSIRSYTRNINTHWAYKGLRKRRKQMRLDGEVITGLKLAEELDLYSTRREDYTRDIITLIRRNGLEQLATVRLRPAKPSAAAVSGEKNVVSPWKSQQNRAVNAISLRFQDGTTAG